MCVCASVRTHMFFVRACVRACRRDAVACMCLYSRERGERGETSKDISACESLSFSFSLPLPLFTLLLVFLLSMGTHHVPCDRRLYIAHGRSNCFVLRKSPPYIHVTLVGSGCCFRGRQRQRQRRGCRKHCSKKERRACRCQLYDDARSREKQKGKLNRRTGVFCY